MKLLLRYGCPQCGEDLAANLVRVDVGVFVCDVCLREFSAAEAAEVA
jgi:ribosomal protein L37AE/L43A